jgi:hypothetical protein
LGARGGSPATTVASGEAEATIVAARSSSSVSTWKLTVPNRTSCPERKSASPTRWLSTNVPLALPWSTTAQFAPRLSMRACLRETEPSATTTSHVGSRPTRACSFETSMGAPEAGTSLRMAMLRGF